MQSKILEFQGHLKILRYISSELRRLVVTDNASDTSD
jgi:hypothetical protein